MVMLQFCCSTKAVCPLLNIGKHYLPRRKLKHLAWICRLSNEVNQNFSGYSVTYLFVEWLPVLRCLFIDCIDCQRFSQLKLSLNLQFSFRPHHIADDGAGV